MAFYQPVGPTKQVKSLPDEHKGQTMIEDTIAFLSPFNPENFVADGVNQLHLKLIKTS
jgi:hypothetical protein